MPTEKPTLRFDFEAILRLEEKGMFLLDGGIKEADLKKLGTFMTLAWAGLLHTNPELTEAQAREWARGMKPKEVIDLVTAALQEALGNDESAAATPPAAS